MLSNLKTFYEGSVCVVTGATSGNGEAVAKLLLKLGAEVHGIGRNQKKLDELARRGIFSHSCDISKRDQVAKTVSELPSRIDYFFHLAGNAVIGEFTLDDTLNMWNSDYNGPINLLRSLFPRITSGGGVGLVTSASAGMQNINEIALYQEVKRTFADSVCGFRSAFEEKYLGLTLISMGVVDTDIWNRTPRMPKITGAAVRFLIPGPGFWAPRILKDVANHRPVSYPGIGACFAPVSSDGQYQTNPYVEKIASEIVRFWFKKFPPT